LDELGKALEKHVRKEERELFPMIEAKCNEQLLEKINQLLSPHL
jgi:iron-sulfur cluster repair protein YtfE (RIC family)